MVDGECALDLAEMERCLFTPGRPHWRLNQGKVVAQCTESPEQDKEYQNFRKLKAAVKENPAPDLVNHPSHYTAHPREVIDIIKDQLLAEYGLDGFRAYCWGNEIKYRMRAGLKGDAAQDIEKAMKYKEFREAL
jgi:hypothetical protein